MYHVLDFASLVPVIPLYINRYDKILPKIDALLFPFISDIYIDNAICFDGSSTNDFTEKVRNKVENLYLTYRKKEELQKKNFILYIIIYQYDSLALHNSLMMFLLRNLLLFVFELFIILFMSYYIKHPNAEYVMPFLFNMSFLIPVLSEFLKEEINPIKYVYGALHSEWSGGRPSLSTNSNLYKIEKYLLSLKKMKLTPTFTFTNLSLTRESLKDEYCNQLLDIGVKNNCHFIVASDILYKHIKSRYKEALMICSVIVPYMKFGMPFFNETKFYNKMLDKYEIVVVRPEWTLENFDIIYKLIKEPSRIEVLINQSCAYNCPNVKRHYKIISELEHNKITYKTYEKIWTSFCPQYINRNNQKSLVINDKIIDKLLSQGVKKIKLQGRNYSLNEMLGELNEHFFASNISQEKIRQEIQHIYEKIQKYS